MSRAPASLSYLVIYNPLLRATDVAGLSDDDEDAHERAQILFYTASERATSRDRMLRQVGLAQALISFTEGFANGAECESVHAQGKRLIMLSPEPDFWLHAAVTIGFTPRATKAKASEPPSSTPPVYHEHTVHDAALRSHLLRGYEDFKLLHGTFASVLAQPNGRQILERQLDRFFTVWAWKWDIESPMSLQDHFGMRVHPLTKSLAPLVEGFETHLPPDVLAVVATATHIVPTSSSPSIPPSLMRHLISVSPPYESEATTAKQLATRRSRLNVRPPGGGSAPAGKAGGTMNFFNTLSMPTMTIPSMTMPAMNMPSVNMGPMDVTKWNWSGYLTFGSSKNNSNSSPPIPTVSQPTVYVSSEETTAATPSPSGSRVEVHAPVDSKALSDALAQSDVSEPAQSREADASTIHADGNDAQNATKASYEHEDAPVSTPSPSPSPSPLPLDTTIEVKIDSAAAGLVTSPTETVQVRHEFAVLNAHLPASTLSASSDAPGLIRRKVYHLSSFGFTVAVIWPDPSEASPTVLPSSVPEGVEKLVAKSIRLLEEMRAVADRESVSSPPALSGPPSSALTQHLLARRDETTISGTAGFDSSSSFFFDSERLLNVDLDTEEVYTRTSNPARWFVAHRSPPESGMPAAPRDVDDPTSALDSLYLLDTRKESSLVDVDNEVATVRRRYAI